jgi:transcriptional regulator with XRE-family HTH domain
MTDDTREWDGGTLRRLRKRLGLSQAGLATRLGIHPQTVSKMERGQMPIGPMVKLSVERLLLQ